MHPKGAHFRDFYLIAAVTAVGILLLLLVLSMQWRAVANPGLVLLVVVGSVILFAVAGCIKPVHSLLMTLIFLTSPLPVILDNAISGAITGFMIAVAILGLCLRPAKQAPLGRSDRVTPLCWAFAAYGILAAMHGALVGNEVRFVAGDLFQIIEFSLVYLLVQTLVQDETTVRRILTWVAISAMFTVVWELALFAAGGSALLPEWQEGFSRTIDTNVIFILLALLHIYPVLEGGKQRMWVWILLIPTVLNILLSLTRGIWLSSMVAMVASVFLVNRAYRGKLIRTISIVGLSAILLSSIVRVTTDAGKNLLDIVTQRIVFGESQVVQGLEGTESLAARRFMEIALIAPQILDSPALGKGLGATYEIGGFAVINAGTDDVIDHHYIHNLYLLVAYRMGLVGLALFAWILFRYFRQSLAAWRSLPVGKSKALVAGFLAALVGQIFLSMTWPTILNHPTAGVVALVMALTFRVASIQSETMPRLASESEFFGIASCRER